MTLIAKPVIDKQFWILRENDRKVGNIEACAGGFQVTLNNKVAQFKTIRMAAERVNIQFENMPRSTKIKSAGEHAYGYPVSGHVYNLMWNVNLHLPIYTKTSKSKSWYAAGWYRVLKGRHWQTLLSPKLIMLERYAYQGPYYSQKEANDHSSAEIC